jgi:hypothetical protein
VIDTSPYADSGSTSFSDVQAFPGAFTCSLVGDSTQGVWYTLEGDGACYNATTFGSQFDTILSVYNGEAGCQDLLCLIENHDESSIGYGYGYGGVIGGTSNVVWRTEVGQTYYILLGGFGSNSGPYSFSLAVRREQFYFVLYFFVLLLALAAVAVTALLIPVCLFTKPCVYFYSILPRADRLQTAPSFLLMMSAPMRLLFPLCPILTQIQRVIASQDLTKRSRAPLSTPIREESGTRLWAMDYVTMHPLLGRSISTLLSRSTLESQVVKNWPALPKVTTVALI